MLASRSITLFVDVAEPLRDRAPSSRVKQRPRFDASDKPS